MQLASTPLLILVLLIKVSCFSPHSSLSACHSVEIGRGRCGVVGPKFDILRVDNCDKVEFEQVFGKPSLSPAVENGATSF
jgi:hypothetical protein